MEKCPWDTAIETLGPCKLESSLPYRTWADGKKIQVVVDEEMGTEINKPCRAEFEAAGPRKKLYFDTTRVKCAIVTCGGLCPGINDVIRAIVLEAHHAYNVRSIIGIPYGLEGFIPKFKHPFIELTPDVVSDIHMFGGTILGSSRGPQPFDEIVDTLERNNINALFIIGGDGTMKAAASIYEVIKKRNLKISVIGIPKTIDNDINFIPKSFGFETAVTKATEAIECAHIEACGTPNGIGIVKLMGRESGFIAAEATLALKEVNFVLIPEITFSLHGEGGLLPAIKERLLDRGHAVIVTAEGAGQHLVEHQTEKDASGNRVLGNFANLLRTELGNYLKNDNIPHSIKFIDPSYIIRSVPANAPDKVYCGFLGQYAVHAAMAGRTDMVVAQIQDRYVHLPLSLVTQARRTMNIRSDIWRAVLESTGQGRLYGMLPKEDEEAQAQERIK